MLVHAANVHALTPLKSASMMKTRQKHVMISAKVDSGDDSRRAFSGALATSLVTSIFGLPREAQVCFMGQYNLGV
jgi:hypothetical protein